MGQGPALGNLRPRHEDPDGRALRCNTLDKIPTIRDEAELTLAYRELNKIFMETIPVLPVMYRPTQYYQFSTKHWTNFPTEENPYAPPQHLIVAAGVKALWEIQAVK